MEKKIVGLLYHNQRHRRRRGILLAFSGFLLLSVAPSDAVPQAATQPSPTSANSGPTLEVTMKYIQDKLNDVGPISYVSSWDHKDTLTGHTNPLHMSITTEVRDVNADPNKCRLSYHEKYASDGKAAKEDDHAIVFGQGQNFVVKSLVQYETERNASIFPDDSNYSTSPGVTVVALPRSDAAPYEFKFTDAAVAERIARALAHAVELCGGEATIDPFSGDKDPFAVAGANAPGQQLQQAQQAPAVDNSQRINQLRSEIEVAESQADSLERSADEMANGSTCSGPGAGACQMIGNLGAARQRKEANKARNEADNDREEIQRLQGEEVESHQRRSTSYGAALNQVNTEHPTPTINDVVAQQQTQANANAAAIQQRQAAQAAEQRAAAEQAELRRQETSKQAAQAAELQRQRAIQAAAQSQASISTYSRPISAPQPVSSSAHAAYFYKGYSYTSHTALMSAAKADHNCALHPENGEQAPCDDTIAIAQTLPSKTAPQSNPRPVSPSSQAGAPIWIAFAFSEISSISADVDLSGDGSWGVGTNSDRQAARYAALNNCNAQRTTAHKCSEGGSYLASPDGTQRWFALAVNLDAQANDVTHPWKYGEAFNLNSLQDAQQAALNTCQTSYVPKCTIVSSGQVGGTN